MSAIAAISGHRQDLTTWRRHLHRYPELAFEEVKTAEFVAEKLESWGLAVHRGLARTGVVATLTRGQGRSIGLRADMDALPIQEANTFDHCSSHAGTMHACGHDGHTTMLLGAARYLAEHGAFTGTVRFIFQPAEEAAGGAKVMIDEGLFERFPVDAVFGMHNWPGLPAGAFALRRGPLMASMDCFDIEVSGRGGHGALPHQATDAVLAAANIVVASHAIVSRNVDPLEAAAISVTRLHGGDSHNVLPDTVLLSGAIRCFDPALRQTLKDRLAAVVDGVSAAVGTTASVEYVNEFPAVVNWDEPTVIAQATAEALVGPANVDSDAPPVMVSEDFSFMLERIPGCFVFIGNGPGHGGCGIHNSRYDFNDDILPVGASYWCRLVERFLATDHA